MLLKPLALRGKAIHLELTLMPEIFSRPAPRAFAKMREVSAKRNDPAPRKVLRLDQAGKDVAARTIARPLSDAKALENLVPEEAPRTIGSRARAGFERLARQRQGAGR